MAKNIYSTNGYAKDKNKACDATSSRDAHTKASVKSSKNASADTSKCKSSTSGSDKNSSDRY